MKSPIQTYCSGLPGIVLAPSLPTFSLISSEAVPAWTFCGFGGWATIRSSLLAAISSPSLVFHVLRTCADQSWVWISMMDRLTSAEGAHPRIPGWMSPGNLTWGMWREVQKIPSKSQIALALYVESASRYHYRIPIWRVHEVWQLTRRDIVRREIHLRYFCRRLLIRISTQLTPAIWTQTSLYTPVSTYSWSERPED